MGQVARGARLVEAGGRAAPADAEAQYGVGTFVWQLLSTTGGGAAMAAYNPWPHQRPTKPAEHRRRPATAPGDITRPTERRALADQGIAISNARWRCARATRRR